MWISPAVDATAISESVGDMARAVIRQPSDCANELKCVGEMAAHPPRLRVMPCTRALPDRRNDLGDGITLRGISGEGAVGAAHGLVHGDRKIARDAAFGKKPQGGAVAATAQQHVVPAECDDPERFNLASGLVGCGIAQLRVVKRPACAGVKIITGNHFRPLDDARTPAARELSRPRACRGRSRTLWFRERSLSRRCNIAAPSTSRRTRRLPPARPSRRSIRGGAADRIRRNQSSRWRSRLRRRRASGHPRRPW